MLFAIRVIKLLEVIDTEHGVNPELTKSCKGQYIIEIKELIWSQTNQIKSIMFNKHSHKTSNGLTNNKQISEIINNW